MSAQRDSEGRVSAQVLRELLFEAFAKRGLSAQHASWVSAALVETSTRGVDTHGIRLAPTYLRELEGGRANAKPCFQVSPDAGTVRTFDADNALGIVAGIAAVDTAISLAEEFGSGVVSVARSNHFGAAATYALRAARQGKVALAMSNSDALVAAPGGRAPVLGTNPISIAIPQSGEPICMDFATSQVSYTKLSSARARGEAVPSGCGVDAEGRDLSEDSAGEFAALLPLGGYKGFALGTIVELLCSGLSGMAPGHELSHLYTEPFDAPRGVSHLFIVFDVGDKARSMARSIASVSALIDERGGVRTGAPELVAADERAARGIPVDDELWRMLLGSDKLLE